MTVLLPRTYRVSNPIPASPGPKVLSFGQSNASGQAANTFPGSAPFGSRSPYYCRCEDEKLGRIGFWDPCGEYAGDQSVGSLVVASIATTRVKHGFHPQCDTDLRAAGKTPIFANISRSGTDLTHWLAGQVGQTFFATIAAEILATPGVTNANWHVAFAQGENDASLGGAFVTNRQANVTAVAAFIRSIFPAARFYMIKLNSATGVANIAAIQAADAAFVAADGNAETLDCDAFGYVAPHYTSAGCNSIGSLLATRILAHLP